MDSNSLWRCWMSVWRASEPIIAPLEALMETINFHVTYSIDPGKRGKTWSNTLSFSVHPVENSPRSDELNTQPVFLSCKFTSIQYRHHCSLCLVLR